MRNSSSTIATYLEHLGLCQSGGDDPVEDDLGLLPDLPVSLSLSPKCQGYRCAIYAWQKILGHFCSGPGLDFSGDKS